MDISQAFPLVTHERLIRGLKHKRVPTAVVRMISSFLSSCSTRVVFNHHVSEVCPVPNGRSSLIVDELLGDNTSGLMDDNSRLEAWHSVVKFAIPCSNRLGLRFDLPKFQLVHFVLVRRHRDHYHDDLKYHYRGYCEVSCGSPGQQAHLPQPCRARTERHQGDPVARPYLFSNLQSPTPTFSSSFRPWLSLGME
jgi:hypothetical protein